jgi:putative ABC transport system substrate-binding protein
VIRRLLVLVALGIAASFIGAEAQPAARVPRVAVLNPGSSTEVVTVQREPFERGLRELGWTPGSNIAIDYRYGEGNAARLAESAVEVVRLGVDVIVARGAIAVRAARQATATVAIVMSSADDPVADGFVTNLARPGGNITGIANLVSELNAKRLELLKEAVPGLSRVGVLTNPQMRTAREKELNAALIASGRSLNLDVRVFEVTRPEEISEAFAAADKARAGALLLRADTLVLEPNRPRVVALAAKHRLPVMYPWQFYPEIGGLMSYATSIPAFHHRSATYVDRILKGAKPGDLPVEQPTTFELVVNVATAKALGLTIPQSLLLRADRLIQMTATAATGTVQVDTAEVQVTEWRLPAGSAIGRHRHARDYVVVPITDGELTVVSASGVARSPIRTGQSYFRKAGVEHDVRNETAREIVFVEIEIKH